MRKILIIFSFLFISMFISSCSKSKEDKSRIKFWHFWSEPNQKQALLGLIAKFEKEYNCQVELTELSWNDGKTKLIAAFNSGTGPDVVELGSDWIAQFSSQGVLAELNQDSVNLNKFVEFSKEPCFWGGKLYAIPWVVDTRVLFYNKDILMQSGRDVNPPETFAQLLELSRAVHLGNNIYGFGANGSDPHRLYKKILPFFWSFGGDIFDKTGKLVLYSKANIDALSFYSQLSQTGMIETQRQLDAAFLQGKIAFWISGSWLLDKIKNENPKLNFGVSKLPGLTSFPGYSFAGGEYISINEKSDKKDLAMLFAKYLTNGVNSKEFCKLINEAGFPADKECYNDSTLIINEYKKVFAEQLQHSKMTPVHPKWLDIEEIIENAVVKVMYGKLGADSALKAAEDDIKLLLNDK